MERVDLWQLLWLKTLMVGHGGSSAGSYLADPTSPIPSHCSVIILFKGVPVHQLSWLALQELIFLQAVGDALTAAFSSDLLKGYPLL